MGGWGREYNNKKQYYKICIILFYSENIIVLVSKYIYIYMNLIDSCLIIKRFDLIRIKIFLNNQLMLLLFIKKK